MVRSFAHLVSGLSLVWATASCTHEEALDIAPGKPRRIESAPTAAQPVLAQFVLATGSVATFTFDTGERQITGHVPVVRSALAVDFADLSRSTARITFSLRDLSLNLANGPKAPFPADILSKVRAWTQQSPPFSGQFYPEAEFILEKVGSRKSRFLPTTRRLPTADSSLQTRRIRAFATGSLALHGVRRLYTLPLTATFHYHANEDLPRSAVFESRGQATLDLKTHRMAPWPSPSSSPGETGSAKAAPVVGISFHWRADRVHSTLP